MTRASSSLQELIEPAVTGLGYDLWGLERLPQGNRALVRIFIDSPEGIDVDDCARVSRHLSSLLDAEDAVAGQYTLEVSSPGMDRRLFTPAQFAAYLGAQVQIRLRMPVEGRRKFSGRLHGLEGDEVVLLASEQEHRFPFKEIERANIVPDLPQPGEVVKMGQRRANQSKNQSKNQSTESKQMRQSK